jgi:hypothetical protein
MFKTELDKWYDSLPPHAQAWLKKQSIWNDRDMFKMVGLGFLIGLCIGYIL